MVFQNKKRSYIVSSCFISIKVKVSAFIIDNETIIQIGDHYYWLRICIELINKSVLEIYISEEA
jgi:transposase-like protein